ncbi:MAG: terminase large subunit [Phenylobacterium sp.]|nr:terminase large subunit [Phenylobacterium sp.]
MFKRLRLADVPGKPRLETAAGQWFLDIIAALFGALDPETQIRMLQEVFLLVPKGNSKTTYAASTMLTAIIVNQRPAAEFVLVAPTIKVADRAYAAAAGAIKADPELHKLFHLQEYQRLITHRGNDSFLSIKSADTSVVTGSMATGTLIDETHEFGTNSRAADIFTELRGALGKRPDGFLIQITTQSKSPPTGIFKQELQIARAVRDGELRANLLPVLYELPLRLAEKDGWRDPRLWPLVNPNLGLSIHENFLRTQLAVKTEAGKDALSLFASQHFNVEIGLGLKADRWRGADYWETAVEKGLTLASLKERCEVVVFGVDGGGLDDLFGITAMGREKGTRRWLSVSLAWVQSDVLENRKEIAPKLRELEETGDLIIFDLERASDDEDEPFVQDFAELADLVAEFNDAGLLPEKAAIGLDAAGVDTFVDALVLRGITEDQFSAVPQGYRLMGAIKAAERALKSRTWRPADQALMTWCVGNAKAIQKGSAVLIEKQTSGVAKIDPLLSAFNAIRLISRNPDPAPKVDMGEWLKSAAMVA